MQQYLRAAQHRILKNNDLCSGVAKKSDKANLMGEQFTGSGFLIKTQSSNFDDSLGIESVKSSDKQSCNPLQ